MTIKRPTTAEGVSRIDPRVSPDDLPALAAARRGVVEAYVASTPHERYAAAHLASLRAAAAVLAVRTRPAATAAERRARSRPRSAWELLSQVAPELAEWAGFFAAGAAKRAAAEAGLPGAVTSREADDLLRDAERFLSLVETLLGVPHRLAVRSVSRAS